MATYVASPPIPMINALLSIARRTRALIGWAGVAQTRPMQRSCRQGCNNRKRSDDRNNQLVPRDSNLIRESPALSRSLCTVGRSQIRSSSLLPGIAVGLDRQRPCDQLLIVSAGRRAFQAAAFLRPPFRLPAFFLAAFFFATFFAAFLRFFAAIGVSLVSTRELQIDCLTYRAMLSTPLRRDVHQQRKVWCWTSISTTRVMPIRLFKRSFVVRFAIREGVEAATLASTEQQL